MKVTRNRDWNEWVVKAWDTDGKRFPEADYHTTDKADAMGTAKLMLNYAPKNSENNS